MRLFSSSETVLHSSLPALWSDQSPVHSVSPQGFRIFTNLTSPEVVLTRSTPMRLSQGVSQNALHNDSIT